MTSPALREVWVPPAAGPCSDDSDDEDCNDGASGSNVELDAEVLLVSSRTVDAPSRPTVVESSTLSSTTSRPAPTRLLTVQLPPREASVFLDDLEQSGGKDQTGDTVVLYDGGSTLSSSLGMNIGLIGGIAAGIVVLTLILAYAVCKYRGGRRGSAAGRGKGPRAPGMDPGVTAETGLLSGVVADHDGRKTTTTPLLYRDPASNNAAQKTANGFDSDLRRKRKDVNEWYV